MNHAPYNQSRPHSPLNRGDGTSGARLLTSGRALFTHKWIPWPLVFVWIAVAVGALAGCSTADTDAAIQRERQAVVEQQARADAAAKELRLANAAADKARADVALAEAAKTALAAEIQRLRDAAQDTASLEKKLAEESHKAAVSQATADALRIEAEKSKAIKDQADFDRKIHEGVAAALEKVKEAKTEPARVAGETVQTVSTFLPEPWKSLAGIVGGAIVAAAGTRQIVRKPLVEKIENQGEALGTMSVAVAGGVVPLSPEAKTLLNSLQSDGAKAAVRESQQKFAVAMSAAANTPGKKGSP